LWATGLRYLWVWTMSQIGAPGVVRATNDLTFGNHVAPPVR
jgi:hypothetical protein